MFIPNNGNDNTKPVDKKELEKIVEKNKTKKRQKKVFTTAMVAHVWAQQTQDEGRNAQGNVYFKGTDLFSYGSHYLSGRIHTLKNGKKVALINNYNYSPTTAKHQYNARYAVDGLMPYFNVPAPSLLHCMENVSHFKEQVESFINTLLAKKKVTSKDDITWYKKRLSSIVNEANEFFAVLDIDPIVIPKTTLNKITDHLNKRLERYKELNTPEMIAKREANRQKRAEQKLAKDIQEFREGKNRYLYNLPYALLRIQGDEVVTSRGARVPVKLAMNMLTRLLKNENVIGKHIASFTIDAITENDSLKDKVLKVGCHQILLSEAIQVLGSVRL